MLTFTQAASRVASRLNKNINDSNVATRIKNEINDTCLEKWHGFAWSFRYREYPIVLTPRVTSGTMTATNGSQTITASGTPFDSTVHVGAWIRFTADTTQAWYRILAIASTSSATIQPAYQGTTGSGKAYELNKTDYLIPLEISDVGSLSVTYNGLSIPLYQQIIGDKFDFPPISTGVPVRAEVFNQSNTQTTYTTGTVTGTINTSTLTGSGTSWLSNVTPGDEIVINGDTNTYVVHRVDSDTSMSLYNNLGTAAAGATYTISRQYGKVLRLWGSPDQPYVIFIKGLRKYAPLVNSIDTNELLFRYPHAVIEGAVWREAGASPDPREDSLFQRSEMAWQRAMGEDETMFPVTQPRPIWNDRAY